MTLNYLGILAGLAILLYGANSFVNSASGIASRLGMPPLLIGLTIVALATSMPELLVGVVAAFNGKTEIAIGNAIGSNIANIGLVLGTTVLIKPIYIASKTLKQEYILMLLATLLPLFLMVDQYLSRLDSIILLIGLLLAMCWLIYAARRSPVSDFIETTEIPEKPAWILALLFFFGISLLIFGADLLVKNTVIVAKHYGISDLVIGLTIIAVGTSLPELATSVVGAFKKQYAIAIGNMLGSNLFNMLAVIGAAALVSPSNFSKLVLLRDFPIMVGLSLMMGWILFVHSAGKFDRAEGGVLVVCFSIYQYWLLST